MEREMNTDFWIKEGVREGVAHQVLSVVIAGVLLLLHGGWDAIDVAALGVMAWFGSREVLDLEREFAKLGPSWSPLVGLAGAGAAALVLFLVEPDPLVASTALSCWLVSRLVRRAEIHSLPPLWYALGFTSLPPLRPALLWTLEQLRHSLYGWVTVWLIWMPVYVMFG